MNKRNIQALEDEASKSQAHGQYAEAATDYARVAAAYLDDNVLIYARYCHEAFRMWLKAKNVENALQQAQDAFRVLDDTGWLEKSMEQVLGLMQMIDELKAAGYSAEADTFAHQLNEKLGEFGLMLKPVSGGHESTICPACGASLPHFNVGDEIKCSYCGYVIQAN